jgi:methyltransferase family protein
MDYLDYLPEVHRRLRPQAYLEIGVRWGHSLALSRCRSVGVDPAFGITAELDGDVALFRTTSDEYFSRPDPLAPTGGVPFDLAFIDGLHLFEYSFRDFVFAERHSSAKGVIVFDDVLPRSVDEAARERHTNAWTGDVFLMIEVLAEYRPGLVVVPINTQPTGLLMVLGLDPTSTVLADNFDEILATRRRQDPQVVPPDVMDRSLAVPPQRFLESGVLEALAELPADADHSQVAARISDLVGSGLGAAFVPSTEPAGAASA